MSEQLIRQAIRELHIDIEPHNRAIEISPVLAPKDEAWANAERTDTIAFMVSGTNRKGDPFSLKIEADTPYPQIVEAIKAQWRG